MNCLSENIQGYIDLLFMYIFLHPFVEQCENAGHCCHRGSFILTVPSECGSKQLWSIQRIKFSCDLLALVNIMLGKLLLTDCNVDSEAFHLVWLTFFPSTTIQLQRMWKPFDICFGFFPAGVGWNYATGIYCTAAYFEANWFVWLHHQCVSLVIIPASYGERCGSFSDPCRI